MEEGEGTLNFHHPRTEDEGKCTEDWTYNKLYGTHTHIFTYCGNYTVVTFSSVLNILFFRFAMITNAGSGYI